jgi:hypothetical protein
VVVLCCSMILALSDVTFSGHEKVPGCIYTRCGVRRLVPVSCREMNKKRFGAAWTAVREKMRLPLINYRLSVWDLVALMDDFTSRAWIWTCCSAALRFLMMMKSGILFDAKSSFEAGLFDPLLIELKEGRAFR